MAQEMQVPAGIAVWFANGYLLAAAMTLAIFAALAARLGYRPVFLAGLTTFTLTSLGCALANKPEVLIGMRVLQGIGGAATLSMPPQYSGPYSRTITWPHSGVPCPAHCLQLRYRPGIGWYDPSHPELAMAVCDKRSSRHPRLTAGGQSAAAGCDPYAGALRHPGRHIVGAAVGFDDHGGEQPTERYFSIRQPLLDGSRCAERHGFLSGKSAARVIPYCRRPCLKMNVLPSRPSRRWLLLSARGSPLLRYPSCFRANTATVR